MREALGKLIDAVEALTKHASTGSPSHALIAEAKKLFVAATPLKPSAEPSKPSRGAGRAANTTEEPS